MRKGFRAVIAVALTTTLACGSGDNFLETDASTEDARAQDASASDGSTADAAVADAAVADAAVADAAVADAAASDAAVADAAVADAAVADAAVADAAVDAAPPDAGSFSEPDYDFLSETGLYEDILSETIASGIIEFVPAYKLWSDGSAKRRWILLPTGRTIDTSNMDHWQFPIGTKVWKQFTHEIGPNTLLLETRLTEKWGPNAADVYQASFVWNANDTDASFSRFGATNVKGTDHDVPAVSDCVRCHRGETSKVLGFQAVQLSHEETPNIEDFAALDFFSDAPASGGYPVPGNAVESAAIGTIHANCGHCHNNSNVGATASACYSLPQLQLWTKTTDAMVLDTYAYLMTVDQPLSYWLTAAEGNVDGYTTRIVRGEPENSAIFYRMGFREAGQAPPLDDDQQMPPIFTDVVDTDGLAAVEAWILSL